MKNQPTLLISQLIVLCLSRFLSLMDMTLDQSELTPSQSEACAVGVADQSSVAVWALESSEETE